MFGSSTSGAGNPAAEAADEARDRLRRLSDVVVAALRDLSAQSPGATIDIRELIERQERKISDEQEEE